MSVLCRHSVPCNPHDVRETRFHPRSSLPFVTGTFHLFPETNKPHCHTNPNSKKRPESGGINQNSKRGYSGRYGCNERELAAQGTSWHLTKTGNKKTRARSSTLL